jgi:hypothetical protein
MKFSLFIYFSIIFCTYSKVLVLEKYKKPSKIVRAVKFNNILIDDNCAKKLGNCLAYKSLKSEQTRTTHIQSNLVGSPASKTCKLVDGVPLILKDEKKNESLFCFFKDNSFIDAWDLKRGLK